MRAPLPVPTQCYKTEKYLLPQPWCARPPHSARSKLTVVVFGNLAAHSEHHPPRIAATRALHLCAAHNIARAWRCFAPRRIVDGVVSFAPTLTTSHRKPHVRKSAASVAATRPPALNYSSYPARNLSSGKCCLVAIAMFRDPRRRVFTCEQMCVFPWFGFMAGWLVENRARVHTAFCGCSC